MTKQNEINCVYIKNVEKIHLLFEYNNIFLLDEEKKIYEDAKNYMNDIYKNAIDLYINDKKMEFNPNYSSDIKGKIKVKYVFHRLLTNTSFMFFKCSSLESIDLSSFDSTKVENMTKMFYNCSSLNSINLSSISTTNVKNMTYMFYGCKFLLSIDLSSFNTTNVTDMNNMFYNCSSLKKENVKLNKEWTTLSNELR